jgi:hypothetical protein
MADHGLSNHHSSTLADLFDHQKHTIEWRKVESLLKAIGTVTEEHNGHLKVTVGPESETFTCLTARTSTVSRSSTSAGC